MIQSKLVSAPSSILLPVPGNWSDKGFPAESECPSVAIHVSDVRKVFLSVLMESKCCTKQLVKPHCQVTERISGRKAYQQ